MAVFGSVADIVVEAHSSPVTDQPEAYIAAAFSRLGIPFHSIVVSSYEPMVFGNLLASAQTTAGALRITYDRGFFVDADQWAKDAPSLDEVVAELTAQRDAASGSRPPISRRSAAASARK